jgi:hypothetical protein
MKKITKNLSITALSIVSLAALTVPLVLETQTAIVQQTSRGQTKSSTSKSWAPYISESNSETSVSIDGN